MPRRDRGPGGARRDPGQRLCQGPARACSTGSPGAISLAGGNIIDARIHTTGDGMALDNFLVQDIGRAPVRRASPAQPARSRGARARSTGQEPSAERLAPRALPCGAPRPSPIQPAVFVDNQASNRYTVVEVNARDRAALLFELPRALFESKAIDPQRPYRHLWRARGRRLLSDRPERREDRGAAARLKALKERLLKRPSAGDARRRAAGAA